MIWLILLPLLSAFIGWLTNYAAIKMLFRPQRPMGVGRFRIQGVVPRRRVEVARRLGEVIEREILDHDLIQGQLAGLDLEPRLRELARRLIREKLAQRLERIPVLGNFLPQVNLDKIEDWLTTEMDKQVRPMVNDLASDIQDRLPIKDLVEERILALDVQRLEDMIHRIARREFRSIEAMGAILGFLVGLIQIILLLVTGQIELG